MWVLTPPQHNQQKPLTDVRGFYWYGGWGSNPRPRD
jgi:hypothetical protein